jgi:hypothetical protein
MGLIGISGRLGTGKDTVASLIQANSERTYQRKRFADILKKMSSALLGVGEGVLEDRDYKEETIAWLGTTPRYVMQTLGNDWGRNIIDKDIWVKALMFQYNPNTSNWIVPDVRYPNEAEAIKKDGGILIRVVRTYYNDPHPTETALDDYNDWDHVINNNGTLDELSEKVKYVCEAYGL